MHLQPRRFSINSSCYSATSFTNVLYVAYVVPCRSIYVGTFALHIANCSEVESYDVVQLNKKLQLRVYS